MGLGFVAACIAVDLRSSWIESYLLSAVARHHEVTLDPGPSGALPQAGRGPYDTRLGYTRLGAFVHSLKAHGWTVASQAHSSQVSLVLNRLGLFPIYHEKDQAGLQILDEHGKTLRDRQYPRRIYSSFSSIPSLVVRTLTFIENRDLLNRARPHRNPAIQWGRFSRALYDVSIRTVDHHHPLVGGSTLATQMEKLRHSPGGRTASVREKFRQMASASLRAYQNGPDTLPAQRQLICDYLNSIPLAARGGQGEIIGLADGLRSWYGADFDRVNRLLAADGKRLGPAAVSARARTYREVLSLLLALRQPSRALRLQPEALSRQVDSYLRALAAARVISPRLRDAALRTRLPLLPPHPNAPDDFTSNKGSNAIRSALLPMLGLSDTYTLDRLDLSVATTLDRRTQLSVSRFLDGLRDPDAARAAGLDQYQLLDRGDPRSVIYSVTLYERGRNANLIRIQTDNFNEPLDINQGTRLQLGSTAKLRTLINYLQIIEQLHGRLAGLSRAQLQAVPILPGDHLTEWAVGYLSTAPDRSLESMLQAALQRRYSASPAEAFFTAGGLHTFANFERSEDSQIMTVSQGFQQSVNLVFLRLMRDIERYYRFQVPGASPDVLSNPASPGRRRYLERFADYEGRTFLRRYYEKYDGQTPDQALQTLGAGIPLTPLRAAVIFRSVRPQASLDAFTTFLHAHLPAAAWAMANPAALYAKYAIDRFSLNDRGYLAHVHPLELWLLNFRETHPAATLQQVYAASAPERQEVYHWLFQTRFKQAQDERIETLLEIDAFQRIHDAWQRLGYPFDSLVPSYATSIGVSGDTPEALAELAGILVNNGVRYPLVRIQQVHFAQGTPFETVLRRRPTAGEPVLSPVIARLVREEMIGVVENGTGRRAHGGMTLPDGVVLPIGGKTGTGDNRFREFGAHNQQLGSRVVNRTAAFVFFIGNRFYGTVLAFVPDGNAGHYGFTSALAVQILKDLEPRLMPLLTAPAAVAPPTRA